MSNHQINQSVSIQNSTTFPLTTTTYSPIKQELSNNSNISFALQQQQLDRYEISRQLNNLKRQGYF